MEDYKSYPRRNPSFQTRDFVRVIIEGATLVLALSFIAGLFILFSTMDTVAPLQILAVLP